MNSRVKSAALSTTMLATVLIGVGAAAAEASGSVDEIVVTAQKRTQNIEDVPLAVQVIGASQLAAANVVSFEDFNRVAPSLLIRSDVQPINATVAIRGIGTNSFGIGVEPSVAVVVDDVPLAFQARAFSDMADISRVEVLGGPQSTLYGKSSTAGLINIVTPNPTSTFTASAAVTGTTDLENDVVAAVAGPISNTLGFRLLDYNDFQGTLKNLYTDSHSDGTLSFNVHGKLVWDPTSAPECRAEPELYQRPHHQRLCLDCVGAQR